MVLETIGAAGVIFKAKYVKRTGTRGNYRYWYRNPKTGKLQAGKQPAKKQGMSESTMRNIQQGGSVGGFIQRQKVDKLKKRLSSEQSAKKPSGSQGDDKYAKKRELRKELAENKEKVDKKKDELSKNYMDERDAARDGYDKGYAESYQKFNKKVKDLETQRNERFNDASDKYYAAMDKLDDEEAKRTLGLSKEYSYGFEKSDKKK